MGKNLGKNVGLPNCLSREFLGISALCIIVVYSRLIK